MSVQLLRRMSLLQGWSLGQTPRRGNALSVPDDLERVVIDGPVVLELGPCL